MHAWDPSKARAVLVRRPVREGEQGGGARGLEGSQRGRAGRRKRGRGEVHRNLQVNPGAPAPQRTRPMTPTLQQSSTYRGKQTEQIQAGRYI